MACADEYLLFELTHRLGQRRHPPGIRYDGREQEEAKAREHCCRPLATMDLVAPWPYLSLDLGLAACGVVGGTYAKTVLIWLELRENLLISSLPTKYGVKTPRTSGAFLSRARFCVTVGYRAIEIDAQEAVSRFLNVHGKSGGQSVNF